MRAYLGLYLTPDMRTPPTVSFADANCCERRDLVDLTALGSLILVRLQHTTSSIRAPQTRIRLA
jgi:hypothetical protein